MGLGVTKKLLRSGNKIGLIIRNETREQQALSEFDARFSTKNRFYITGDKVVAVKHGMTAQEKQALLAGIHSYDAK